jgi:hypothetical protein
MSSRRPVAISQEHHGEAISRTAEALREVAAEKLPKELTLHGEARAKIALRRAAVKGKMQIHTSP